MARGYLLFSFVIALLNCVNCLRVAILQSKGGGHGEIGYAMQKAFSQSKANELFIVQDASYKKEQEPFKSYASVNAKFTDASKLSDLNAVCEILKSNGPFDCVIDNNSKDPAYCTSLSEFLGKSTQIMYISSAGMYTGTMPENGYTEADGAVKPDNDCRKVEEAYLASSPSVSSFRPQYIYGENTNKRGNLDWFLDRISRDAVIPLPGDGNQLVALTHVDDVASMLSCAVGNAKANGEVFNCGTDGFISYIGVCEAVAKAMNKDPTKLNYKFYDPKKLNKELPKPSFPFRPTTFVTNPSKAKTVLGWSGATHTLVGDINKWVEQYSTLGLGAKKFEEDAAVLELIA